jgi:hypothetical protein
MRISPIGVDKLKDYDWYYSEDHNLWYYFKKRKGDSSDKPTKEQVDAMYKYAKSLKKK